MRLFIILSFWLTFPFVSLGNNNRTDKNNYRNENIDAGFLYQSFDDNHDEFVGFKAHGFIGNTQAASVIFAYSHIRRHGDVENSKHWFLSPGYLYRKGNFFPFGEQTIFGIRGFFHSSRNTQTTKGVAVDYKAPYGFRNSPLFITPFFEGRIERDSIHSDGLNSIRVGFITRMALPDVENTYVGLKVEYMNNISSFDFYGMMPHTNTPILGNLGLILDHTFEDFRFHVDLTGTVAFQTGYYFEGYGSVELIRPLEMELFVRYRYNEMDAPAILFQKVWQAGLLFRF